jgi:hypothetical protein
LATIKELVISPAKKAITKLRATMGDDLKMRLKASLSLKSGFGIIEL